jgi:hypothetical protein
MTTTRLDQLIQHIEHVHPGFTVRRYAYSPDDVLSTVEPCERCGTPVVALRDTDGTRDWYHVGDLRYEHQTGVMYPRAWVRMWPHAAVECHRRRARRAP